MSRQIILVLFAAFFATVIISCDSKTEKSSVETRMQPKPASGLGYLKHVDRAALPSHTQKLLVAMEEGKLPGAMASEYQAELDLADKISEMSAGALIIYSFSLVVSTPDKNWEGPPVFSIAVQKKFGHIYNCQISTPEW